MSNRNRILSNQFPDGPVADALREYASERDAILGSLRSSFEADERIRAAWLWGSFLNGDSDDLSDLDIWLLVPDACIGEMADVVRGYCARAGVVVSARENAYNAPAGGGYIGGLLAGSHGLHHLDLYWLGVSSGRKPEGSALVDRLSSPCPSAFEPVEATWVERSLEPYANRIVFVWLMLSVAAKYLARDRESDIGLMMYPKNAFYETATHFGLLGELDGLDWTAPSDPIAKVELLRRVADETRRLDQAMSEAGEPMPAAANGCLYRYLDLVEAILRA